MSKVKTWEQWLFPLSKDVDTTFSYAACAVLSSSGPYSEYLFSLVRADRIREVIEYTVPYEGIALDDFRGATQIQAFFKKNLDLSLGYDPLRAGVEASIKAELQCQTTNSYFGQLCPLGGVTSVISLARRKIAAVLGGVPSLKRLVPRFGPGSTTQIRRSEACFENKLSRPIVCSEELLPSVSTFLAETPEWVGFHGCSSRGTIDDGAVVEIDFVSSDIPVVVDVAKLLFVEKNAKTHRPICVEPVLNGFWQLGVGDYIKDRLRIHAGQDLRNQERNQLLAREGSIDGSLATIDLSSASDTLAFSVVFDLLPEEWVDLLASLRTGHMEYGGRQYELEKFSSMGNGFTFELETLVFWSLAWSAVELSGEDTDKVSVYGDDIIVPVRAYDLLSAALQWCGFSVNYGKSFHQGPFRESCGADWLHGDDVRPIFKKDRLSLQWLFVFHNWALRRGERKLASLALSLIPREFQMFGPDGYGDGHLLGSHEVVKPRRIRRRGFGGGYFHTLREASTSTKIDSEVAHLAGLYDLYSRGPTSWWEPKPGRPPGTVPGSLTVERTSIYTFSEHIFARY